MNGAQQLSGRALAGLCLSFLFTAVALQLAGIGGTIGVGFGQVEAELLGFDFVSLPFVTSIGLTPLIAMLVCRQPLRSALLVAHASMISCTAILFLGVSSGLTTFTLVSIIGVGQQIIAAALLVIAWRSQRAVTAFLAAVFVLPRVINPIVFLEAFATERLFDRTPLLVVAMVLLLASSAAILLDRDEAMNNHSSVGQVDRVTLIAATLAAFGLATTASLRSPYGSGAWSGIGLLVTAVGVAVLLTSQQRRRSIQVNLGLMAFCALALVFFNWVRFGQGSTVGEFSMFFGIQRDFDPVLWSRVGVVLVIGAAVPLIVAIGRADSRYVSTGALLAAASGPIFLFFVLDDRQLGVGNFLVLTVLEGTGGLIVLAGAVTFALRERDEASIQAAAVVVLMGFALVERLAAEFAEQLIFIDLLESDFTDTGRLELFVVTSAVALVWIAAWWAFRPHRAEAPADPHAMIGR